MSRNCHKNGGSVTGEIYELWALAIFMLRDAPEAHDAGCDYNHLQTAGAMERNTNEARR
jgi:hypothetical protein